MATLNTLLDSR